MKPFEFHLLAESLLDKEKNAAGYRSVISRAYYAAFLTALEFLEQMGIKLEHTANSHKHATLILSNSGDDEVNEIAYKLGSLRDERNAADYEMKNRDVEEEGYARLRYQEAEKIITTINKCLQNAEKFAKVSAATALQADFILGR